MKYLKPEMDIVEFDESVLTDGDVYVSGEFGNDGNSGGTVEYPSFPGSTN